MASELHGGSRWDPAGTHSLATYIEAAFNDVRAEFGLPPLPQEGAADRQMLFLGISRGIVDYLGDHSSAFVILDENLGTIGAHDHTGRVQVKTAPIPLQP